MITSVPSSGPAMGHVLVVPFPSSVSAQLPGLPGVHHAGRALLAGRLSSPIEPPPLPSPRPSCLVLQRPLPSTAPRGRPFST